MPLALFRVAVDGGERWAAGSAASGPELLLPGSFSLDELLARGGGLRDALAAAPRAGAVPPGAALRPPLGRQPVWAAGVTYLRSRDAREEESGGADLYARVYEAERPELFFKALPEAVRASGEPVGIRADSSWNVPEPELALVADASGALAAVALANDVSSRSIEGENALYLPQAKVYDGSCSVGPCLVPVDDGDELAGLSLELRIRREGREVFGDRVPVARMRRTPAELLDWLFRALSFPAGALLLSGTSIVPPADFTLAPGDEVSISCPELGRLVNPVEVVGRGP